MSAFYTLAWTELLPNLACWTMEYVVPIKDTPPCFVVEESLNLEEWWQMDEISPRMQQWLCRWGPDGEIYLRSSTNFYTTGEIALWE